MDRENVEDFWNDAIVTDDPALFYWLIRPLSVEE